MSGDVFVKAQPYELGEAISIDDIKRVNADSGRHFFETDTMRFFRSHVGGDVFAGADGWYFVTSEQFEGSNGHREARKYTVRIMHEDGRMSDGLGGFQKYTNHKSALRAIKAHLGIA